jgi:Cellulase (glycosyl hydrolase family 5)
VLRRALCFTTLIVATLAQPVGAATSGDGERLLAPNGVPLFVVGMNYEGPAEHAWQMWDNDKFDAGAIDADFSRAASAGLTTVRIFVQAPLAVDIAAGKFDKLDTVVSVAERRGLQLVVSLHDYGERDLTQIAATAGKVAQRYRGRAGILAFDLKNEPRFGDLSLTKYPSPAPLQMRGLIDAFGERLPRDQLGAYRASDEGTKTIPSYLSDDEAWVYINNLRLYREMLAEASAWVRDHNFQTTTLDFLDDPAGHKWVPLVKTLDQTLAAWLGPQVQAIRSGDPTRPITVDHVDAVLARLPANDALDFESLHRYPGTGAASILSNLKLLGALESVHPGKPYMLSEFGYATETVDPDRAALAETAIMLGLLSQHAAGGTKWMLNDMPDGFNMRERTLGAFRLDGSPKPIVGALAALHAYVAATGSAPGDFRLEDDPDSGLRYVYRASDAVWLGGKRIDGSVASMDAQGPAQLCVSWSEPGLVRLWASTSLQATIDTGQIPGANVAGGLSLAHVGQDGKEQSVAIGSRAGNSVKVALQGGSYVLRTGNPTAGAADYEIQGGHFFTQTNGRKDSSSGFAVTDAGGVPFWTAFQSLGGADVLGYPVTRRFELDGFAVQGFQKTVLQWHPEQNAFSFLNTFDVLHDRGRDDWLEVYRQTPRPQDTSPDGGLAWEQVVTRHLALLDKVPPPLKQRFLADDQWLDHFGLPVSTQEFPNSVVVRAQRATLQYWKEAVPWAAKGSVSVANAGDLAKEAGLFPWLAVTPDSASRSS